MNVVRWQSSTWRGTLWYPFQQLKPVVLVLLGIERAWWKGFWVCSVSPVVWKLSTQKSTVHRGLPFFAHMTMQCDNVTGCPTRTGSSTPRDMTFSSPALKSSHSWSGTGIGVRCAIGSALESTISLIGIVSISGSGWCSHVLNVLVW